ncbi:MAG: SIMPL domain-containing protein [Dehalococcoidales bacterium]|nr:SIMPL domain-containing protein [Dehalococcoidales bacterium]
MNKRSIGIIATLAVVMAIVTACAPPAANGTASNGIDKTPGAASPPVISTPVNTPEGGAGVATAIPGIAPAPPTRGAVDGIGITTPVAPAPAMSVSAGGYTSPYPVLNQYQNQNAGIVVTGQGQIQATPDIATLTLGVSAQETTVAAAQNEASTAMNAVMKVLKDKGIADADITTVGFNINPVYDYRSNTPVITGYQVTNMITVKIRKIADTSAIIDASATAGGNFIRVNSVGFGVNDPTPYLKQARAKAMANAIDTAGQLATLGGVKIGLPIYITESSGYYPPAPMYYASAGMAKDMATPISPGQTEISVSVTVIYAIQ